MSDGAADHKIVILGAGTVGKSAITVRMVADTFKEVYDATIEDRYQCDVVVEGKASKLDILDTAGQEQFAALQHHWIREGDAFLLVYAVNSEATFMHCKKCYQTITRIKEDAGRVDLVLVANKSDLDKTQHQVTYQQGEDLANEWGVPFIMTSAKDNINIKEAYYNIIGYVKVMHFC
eukprot:CAMPEP_0201592892 /NCGR_PEP_ID=MMETSP0190_2-20130828/190657_1 /ASSEMBLY_ACC=CAM_ASM_000263 /TAXON_ID=37353 /ORGANISM="Rosalina sp." /LENGTH=176 /DNA_ID=CAMNT_0048051855 /DNA_START=86 /DNA_END=616 /DNA_ORIENTATION=+